MPPKKKIALSSILDSPIISRLVIGIGEASEITGVSARQLRYWEAKGIIHSLSDKDGSNRKYDYPNIEKIVLLKDFLDQGYTLEAAARRLEERIQQLNRAIMRLSINDELKNGSNMEEVGHLTKIDGIDYIFIGYATHRSSKQRYKIFSPVKENQEELLAESID